MDRKLALITSGGGMTCSYSAGVISALVIEYGLTKPDIVIADSGSVGTASYYLSEQYDLITKIWSDLLPTKKFVNVFRFWRIINIDYLIDIIIKQTAPLLLEKINSYKGTYIVPVTNCQTGEMEYMSPKDHNIYEIMRAAKAMPVVYNKKVELAGKKYCDTITSSPYIHLKKAIDLGATDIIMIDNRNPGLLVSLFFKTWLSTKGRRMKSGYLKIKKEMANFNLPEYVRIAVVEPSQKLKIKTLSINKKSLANSIKQGYQDCKENNYLQNIINKLS